MSNGAKIMVILLVIAGLIGAALFFAQDYLQKKKAPPTQSASSSTEGASKVPPAPPIQQELNDLAARMVAEMRQEERLNLNMVGQLRSYQTLLQQTQSYAQAIEKNIKILEKFSENEFQEDVSLQAQLFTGKKPELVAKHLEEFRASRVGAILAKMKEKEASVVLDIWAERKVPKVRAFYREVMAAYLSNKRQEANPKLLQLPNQEEQENAAAQAAGV